MDVARQVVQLAREATAGAGRAAEVAVAFSVNGDIDCDDGQETIRLLARAFENAYHLKLGDEDVIVAYLIEVTKHHESEIV